LDSNKIIAAAAVAAVPVAIAAIYFSYLASTNELHSTHRPQIAFSRPMEIDSFTCNTEVDTAAGPEVSADFSLPIIWLKNTGNAYATKVYVGMADFGGSIQPKLLPLKPTGDPKTDNPNRIDDATCKEIVQNPRFTSFALYADQEWKFDTFRGWSIAQKPSLGKDAAVRLVVPLCFGYSDDYEIPHATCITYNFIPSTPIEAGSPFFKCGNGQPIKGLFEIAPFGACED